MAHCPAARRSYAGPTNLGWPGLVGLGVSHLGPGIPGFAMRGGPDMRCAGHWWRSLRAASCRLAIGVAADLVGLAIAATGATAATLTVNTLADNAATSTSTE